MGDVINLHPIPVFKGIVFKRKVEPRTRTEVIIYLNGKERRIFIKRDDEHEQEISHRLNPYDKRVFAIAFQLIVRNEIE